MIKDNISRIRGKIASICNKIDRNPDEIVLVGITKYAQVSLVEDAIEAGLTDIGENKIQDAKEKFAALDDSSIKVKKHIVGHLQSNKIKQAVEIADQIQSVDKFETAERIDKYSKEYSKNIDVLIQVNTSGEEQKFGIKADEAVNLVEKISGLKNIRVKGLMTIGPFTEDSELIRKCFRDLKDLQDKLAKKFQGHAKVEMQHLSMGMTDDYEIALEEGANMLRIGRAIFQ